MKEEIERRRAEAAEKRQKVEEPVEGDEKPFKCVSPRGSSLKVSFQFLTSLQCVGYFKTKTNMYGYLPSPPSGVNKSPGEVLSTFSAFPATEPSLP